MAAALAAPVSASPSGHHTYNINAYPADDADVTATITLPQTSALKYTAGEATDTDTLTKEKEGVVGIAVVNNKTYDIDNVKASAENFDASLELNRNNVASSGYTVILNQANTEFTGSSATIKMTSKDGSNQASEDPDHAGSALLVHGYDTTPNDSIDTDKTTKVVFSANETKLSTDMQGAKAGSTNVLHVEGNARVDFTGQTAKISTTTASDSVAFEDEDEDEESVVAGIGIMLEADAAKSSQKTADTANLHTSSGTTLTIDVEGTGEKSPKDSGYSIYDAGGAALIAGIYAEGGEIYAEGDVSVNATAKAGTAVGMALYGTSLDHDSFSTFNQGSNEWEFSNLGKSVSYDHISTFEKKLEVNVKSDTGRTVGILLATPCCNYDGYKQETKENGIQTVEAKNIKDQRTVDSVTKLTVKDLTVNVTKGANNTYASDGILLVNTSVKGTPELVVTGTSEVTADNALRTAYWDEDGHEAAGEVNGVVYVEDGASLTLNGSVNQYQGWLIQKGGTVKLNASDNKFFGGKVKVEGGSFETTALYDSTGFEKNGSNAPVLKVFEGASATVGGLKIGAFDVDETHVKVYGGTLTVKGDLDVQKGGKLGMNDGEVVVTGAATVSGKIAPTANDEAGTEKPDSSLGMLTIDGGSLTLNSTASVDTYRVWLKNGAVFTMDPAADLRTELLFRVDGGTVNAAQVDWDTAKQGRMKIWKDSVVNLKSFTASLTTNDTASFKIFDGTMNVGALNVVAGARIGSNAGTINVTGGNSLIMGSVRPLDVNTAGSPIDEPAPSTSSTVLNVKGGTFTVGSAKATNLSVSNLRVKTLALSDSAKFSNYGTVKVDDSITITGAEFNGTGQLNAKTLNVTDSATLTNSGSITADNTLKVENATFRNYGSVHAKTIELGSGADWYTNAETQEEHFEKTIFGAGSRYIDETDEVSSDDDWADIGTMVLRGGELLTKASDGTLNAMKGVFAVGYDEKPDCDSAYAYGTVTLAVEAGDYAFDGVRIGDGATRTGVLSVSGGSLKVADTLSIGKGSFAVTNGTVTAGKLFVGENATAEISGGSVTANELALSNTLTISGGSLITNTAQVFTTALGENGEATTAEGLSANGKKLSLSDSGVLVMNDAKYNLQYAGSAANLLNASYNKDDQAKSTLWFNGTAVETTVSKDEIPENTVHANITVEVKNNADDSKMATIDKSFGAKDLSIGDGVETVEVKSDKTLTIVGSAESDKTVISGKNVTSLDVGGKLNLGDESNADRGGQIGIKIDVAKEGTVTVENGKFTLEDLNVKGTVTVTKGDVEIKKISADTGTLAVTDGKLVVNDMSLGTGSSLEVKGGDVTVDKMQLAGDAELYLADVATKVKNLVVGAAKNAVHVITGALDVESLSTDDGAKVVFEVGTNSTNDKDGKPDANADKKGALKIGKGSLKGLTFFLDPAWKDDGKVEDASSLIINSDKVDGEIVVGQNSYVVLGTDSADEFLSLVNDGTITWGENGTTAAAYVDGPIKVSGDGKLVVNGSFTRYDEYTGSLNTRATPASVVFAAGSTLVGNVGTLSNGEALITADSFDIDSSAQAILTNVTSGASYTLLAKADGTDVTSYFKNVKAANSLFSLDVAEDGTIKARMNDAAQIYGSAMQGTAIANAAMAAGNTYVNDLLSYTTGTVALKDIAAKFDAAMNPAGALTTFTTAYDRASELRQIVRDETAAADGDNRLWVHVTGGKTKLKGISTGGQDLHTKTTAYGIVVGGEAAVTDGKLGFALTAGTGDTKNHSVSAKDEFNYYGASVYGKATAGSVDILADASATFVKSDLTVGNGAAVDTDVTTSVYSFGVQGRKTFELAAADVTPFIGMDVYHVRGGSYSNGHGAHVQSSNATAVEFPVGVEMSKAFDTASGLAVKPAFAFAVVPTVADRDIDSKVKMAGVTSTYNFTFTDDVKVRGKLGIEAQKENFTFGLHAGYEWGNEERSSANVELRAKYCF